MRTECYEKKKSKRTEDKTWLLEGVLIIHLWPLSFQLTHALRTCSVRKDWRPLQAFLLVSAILNFASRGRWGHCIRKEASPGCICLLLALLHSLGGGQAWDHLVVLCPSCAPRAGSPLAASQPQPRPGGHLGMALPIRIQPHSRAHVDRRATIRSVHPLSALGLPNPVSRDPSQHGHCVPKLSLCTRPEKYETSE